MAEVKKEIFGFDYWLNKLLAIGQQIEPGKYTPEYIRLMQTKWRGKPFTRLVGLVHNREKELKTIQQTTV